MPARSLLNDRRAQFLQIWHIQMIYLWRHHRRHRRTKSTKIVRIKDIYYPMASWAFPEIMTSIMTALMGWHKHRILFFSGFLRATSPGLYHVWWYYPRLPRLLVTVLFAICIDPTVFAMFPPTHISTHADRAGMARLDLLIMLLKAIDRGLAGWLGRVGWGSRGVSIGSA